MFAFLKSHPLWKSITPPQQNSAEAWNHAQTWAQQQTMHGPSHSAVDLSDARTNEGTGS